MCDFNESIKTVAATVGAGTAILGAFYAAWQYRRAKTLEKRRLAWEFLRRLREEEPLGTCTVFLDWFARDIEIPEKFRTQYQRQFDKVSSDSAPLTSNSGDCRETFLHTWDRMTEALKPVSTGGDRPIKFDWPAVIYRDLFDQFFDYLKEIQAALKSDWLDPSDLSPLRYWLQLLTREHRERLHPFLEEYHPELDLEYLAIRLSSLARELSTSTSPQ